jgi:predicted RNase H-like HicB family nuclease
MKAYTFRVVIEPDEDRWFAYSPTLEDRGGATWGYTREDARENIKAVLKMTLESMIEHGEQIPEDPEGNAGEVLPELQIVVSL